MRFIHQFFTSFIISLLTIDNTLQKCLKTFHLSLIIILIQQHPIIMYIRMLTYIILIILIIYIIYLTFTLIYLLSKISQYYFILILISY